MCCGLQNGMLAKTPNVPKNDLKSTLSTMNHHAITKAATAQRKVFCIGINKTGTSTIKHCFRALGITPIASPTEYTKKIREQLKAFYNDRNYAPMLEIAERYQAFEDRPWNMWSMYKHLDQRFPNSLFILTTRDPESWWRSTERWITVKKPEVLHLYQKHLRVPNLNKESMVESYLRYNREVETYFKGTKQLLVLNFEKGDGWSPLCEFLGLPEPGMVFPHANAQIYSKDPQSTTRRRAKLQESIICQNCNKLDNLRKPKLPHLKNKGGAGKGIRSLKPSSRQIKRIAKEFLKDIHNIRLVRLLFYARFQATRYLDRYKKKNQKSHNSVRANELAVVSCFFNPSGSTQRLHNFQNFLTHIEKSNVKCLVVELAFGETPFQMVDHDDVIQVRSNDILWHKERLLNIGIRQLISEGFKNIAWLDGDILFLDSNWPQEICKTLEQYKLCQVFKAASIKTHASGYPMVGPSSVKFFNDTGLLFHQPPLSISGIKAGMLKGGQSGFGWAARAEVLAKVLLYENSVIGGADKLMLAASFTNDLEDKDFASITWSRRSCSHCGYKHRSDAYADDYHQWAERWFNSVKGSVGYANLHITDMFHGLRSDRNYTTRHDILLKHGFDPARDLTVNEDGCLQWAKPTSRLSHDVGAYFLSRREDI